MVQPGHLEEYQTVVLAAFLHDIGKFLGRGTFKLLDKGQHPKFSADFVSAHHALFAQIANVDLLQRLVLKHHTNERAFSTEFLVQSITDPHQRTLASLVSKADNLSSFERGKSSEQYQDYKATPLSSVLERLNRENDDGLRLRFRANHLALTPNREIFPESFDRYKSGELNKLLTDFGNKFRELFSSPGSKPAWRDFDHLATHLSNLVYAYTWCLPSNTQEIVPDVSLFDHLKTTAAIAACLYQYHSQTNTLTEKELADTTRSRFLLAVGDLSGIQSYIFDIATTGVGGVARRLRARSLYVQLCSDIAASLILRRLKLPLWNAIMNSGGRFYLLLPNLKETETLLEEIQQDIDRWFIHELNGELALNLAYYPFNDEGFKAGLSPESGFSHLLYEVTSRLNERKQRRFAEMLQQEGSWLEDNFVLPLSFNGREPCASCHKFPQEAKELCSHCQRDRDIGAKLPQARYIAFFDNPQNGEVPVLGYSATIAHSLPKDIKPFLVTKLNDTDSTDLAPYPATFRHLAIHVPVKDGDIATFEQIAEKANGQHLLGFLKADVDRLGELFAFGLKRQSGSIDTISRQATVSRLLDIFFTGWMEHLTSSEFQDCYTVFSGGDDLFFVGPWDRILEMAERIRTDFADFTGSGTGDQRISLSAGIFIAKPDYPIARASEAVEEALKKSKSEGRDRITLLGTTLTWSNWAKVRPEWQYLRPLVAKSKVPSAFLYNLLRFSQMWQEYKKGNVLGLRYHPLLAYNIARNLDYKKTPELYDWTANLLKWPPGDHQKMLLDNLGLLTTLLIYSRRGGE